MGDSDERDGSDRAAILERRQRFIALTLSGLAACGDGASPTPCLDVAPQTESSATGDGTDGSTSTDSTGMPMPCLDVNPTTVSDSTGPTGPSETTTGDDSGTSSGENTTDTSTGDGTGTSSSSTG